MKQNHYFNWLLKTCNMSILALGMIQFLIATVQAQSTNESKDIIASVNGNNFDDFVHVVNKLQAERTDIHNELLALLKNPQSSDFTKCAAAYHLGEMRAPEAVNTLANQIKLHLDTRDIESLRGLEGSVAVRALIKIGSPSIPAMIRNLSKSDDAMVVELSLLVLDQIEGDKDIVQLRLQKALAAEKDLQRQARLQAALKALAELH
jgi:PBS lyase HEAT-like repeat